MDSLLQIRNFQNLLGRELNWRDRARVSAVCKASRDSLCDPEALRAHLGRVQRSIKDLGRALQEEERLEEDLDASVYGYFEDALPEDTRRLEGSFDLPAKDSSYVVRMAVLIIAFSLDYPQYVKHLRKMNQSLSSGMPWTDEDAFHDLSEGFSRSGLAHAMKNVEDIVGIAAIERSESYRFQTPTAGIFYLYEVGDVLEAVVFMLEQQFRTGVQNNLILSVERARKLVFEPFERFQAAQKVVLENVRVASEGVRIIGLKDLIERWESTVRELSRANSYRATRVMPSFNKFAKSVQNLANGTRRK